MQYSLSWGAPYDPQSYFSSWRIPAHGDFQAQTGLPDKALIDREITSLMTEQSETKRAAMIRDILTRIHDSAVYVPISYSRTKAVYRTSLSGVGFRVSQYEIPFEDMFFKNAK
jgi:nickel transport system substrate-binding protein